MFNFYDWRFYDSICAFYILRNLERPKIWTGPIPRPVSVLDIERDRDRDWSRFWILNGTDTKTGLGSEHWMGPIPRPGIRAQKIWDLTETIPIPRVSLGSGTLVDLSDINQASEWPTLLQQLRLLNQLISTYTTLAQSGPGASRLRSTSGPLASPLKSQVYLGPGAQSLPMWPNWRVFPNCDNE